MIGTPNIDLIENWLAMIGFSHSDSPNTRRYYRKIFQRFLDFAETTPKQIIQDNENMDEKQFKRKYTPLIMSYVTMFKNDGYSPSTQCCALTTIKSFFKYNNLPLNFLPSGRLYVVFHNRDITKQEIESIIKDAQPREKAYYSLMVQSGLRPNEISNLKIGDIEKLLEEKTPIPCLIKIRQEATKGKYKAYFSFMGQESVDFIKEYFKRENRTHLTQEDFLFTKDDGKTKTRPDLISHLFRRTILKLNKQKVLDFNKKKGEKANRNDLRLYNLRKYFRNHAANAGTEFVNFWMGHSLGIDEHYFSQTDIPTHREQYRLKAMPNLRIETKTPDQNEQTITQLQNKIIKQEKTNKKLNELVQWMVFMIQSQQEALNKIVTNEMTKPENKKAIQDGRNPFQMTPQAQEILKKEHPEYFEPLPENIEERDSAEIPKKITKLLKELKEEKE